MAYVRVISKSIHHQPHYNTIQKMSFASLQYNFRMVYTDVGNMKMKRKSNNNVQVKRTALNCTTRPKDVLSTHNWVS